MPISDILKKKHQFIHNAEQNSAVKQLQRWWRNRNVKRGFSALSIWDIKLMLDKVILIQKWYRSLLDKWADRSKFGKETKAIIIV